MGSVLSRYWKGDPEQIDVSTLSLTSKPSTSNGRIAWPDELSKKQSFSLPGSIIYYMARNPKSPKAYLKLAQSCKYFFEKQPILVVRRIYDGGRMLCTNDETRCRQNEGKCCVQIDLTKLTSKLWLTDELNLKKNVLPNISSILVSKFFSSEGAKLIIGSTEMSFEDFKLLAATFDNVYLGIVKITDNDGNDVMLESILEAIPNVKFFSYCFDSNTPTATASTIKNIAKLQNLGNLWYFSLNIIPEIIDVKDFAEFLKDHNEMEIWLHFDHLNISDAYKIQLDQLIDTIIESEVRGHVIEYMGQHQRKYGTMSNRFHGRT